MAKMINSLPKGWQYKKLGDVCEMYQPKTISTKQLVANGKYFVYGANGIIGKYDKYNHENTELLITCRGASCGTVNISKPFSWINGNAMVVKPISKMEITTDYLSYYFRMTGTTSKAITGSAQPQITRVSLLPIQIPIPSLITQQQIVAKIETLFTQIDAALQTLQTLQQQNKLYRQTILQQAFEGKLVNVGKMKWVRVKDTALNIQYGYTESSTKVEVGPKFLRITDIQDNKVNWAEVPFCNINSMDIDKYKLKDGDLVFARTGATVGKSFLISGNIPNAVFASYLIRLRFPENILGRYIWYFFQSNFYWNQIIDKQVGTGQPNVNGTKLGELNIAIPVDLNNQQLIVQAIEKHLSVTDNLQQTIALSIAQAKALKQSILQKAFSGQLIQ